MSKKPLNCLADNGQCSKTEVENGHPSVSPPPLGTSTVEEMVQQMKELITENNELKEAMRQRNQAMKDRFEELSTWREKLKEEREFYETKFKEARQCLATKCVENEALKKQLQALEEREEGSTKGCTVSKKELAQELEQLRAQVVKLQAEKADLVAIISELQLKLNVGTDDSFVEIRVHEGELNGGVKEIQDLHGKTTRDAATYVSRSLDEAKKKLETEELTVSQLLHSLRSEIQKREVLEKELQEQKERLLLENKTAEKGTQVEHEEEEVKERAESVGDEVETLNLQVSALFKELQETHAKLKDAEIIQKKLQEKCQALERQQQGESAGDLDEKQQLLYTIKKLELQVESMQSEIKLEEARANEEQQKFNTLQDAYSKLLPELTKAKQTVEELKDKETERVNKATAEELIHRLDMAEQALAAKQFQLDEMKQTVARQEEELETVAILRTQMELYCSDFHAERAAREKIHEEKEQLAAQLAYLLTEKQDHEDLGRNMLAEMQTRHRLPSDQGQSHFSQGGTEDRVWQQQQRSVPIHSCPKCGMILPDMDTLQIHVMDCII
ncbi:optineurin [Lacerta agilis]|uniref:optineurin n=1 Tax=Lacerta agilis TaxID=80427 RepID=UPI0014195020|nr:optineurin [Lacerta agilis]